jgi:hypothetical protein
MPVRESVLRLCETFAEHQEHFRSEKYIEFQLRKQFPLPLFDVPSDCILTVSANLKVVDSAIRRII